MRQELWEKWARCETTWSGGDGQTGAGGAVPITLAWLHSTAVAEKHRPSVVRSCACKEALGILELYDNFSDLSTWIASSKVVKQWVNHKCRADHRQMPAHRPAPLAHRDGRETQVQTVVGDKLPHTVFSAKRKEKLCNHVLGRDGHARNIPASPHWKLEIFLNESISFIMFY